MNKFLSNNKKYLSISIICLVLGILISLWFRTYLVTISVPKSSQNQNLISMIDQLETETKEMETGIEELRSKITDTTSSVDGDTPNLDRLKQELETLQLLAGHTQVEGDGLIITLDDNNAGAEAAKLADPLNYFAENYILHDGDLRYILNDIGYLANAVSINGQRIVAMSDIRCVGTVIMINSTRVAPPYEISLIGPPSLIEGALMESSQFAYLKSKNMPYKIEKAKDMILPSYTGTVLPKYALEYVPPVKETSITD